MGKLRTIKTKTKMIPLAERMRPRTLDDYTGQEHLVGQGKVLRKAIESNNIPSFILWGPPGVGKTTLASLMANMVERPFFSLSAINSGVKDIRETITKAQSNRFFDAPNPILFIDEIHRFSKSQQDSLLGAVEKGIVTLIGATTENPSFEVISALLSRCQVYVLKPLEKDQLIGLVKTAIVEDEYLKKKKIELQETDVMLRLCGGDARKLYNIVELVCNSNANSDETILINNETVQAVIQRNIAMYDKGGEQHYDIVSAFIKSIRGSDPNGAVYWLARMIEGGEDPKFICRRMVISAAEDIGLANPNALLMATTCFQAVNMIGYPEGRIIMSEAAIYLANSPKSNSAYEAINSSQALVRETGNLPVPLHLRNAPTKLMKDLDYGKDYKYAHSYVGNFTQEEFLPDEVKGRKIYEPQQNPAEKKTLEQLQRLWKDKYGY